MGLAFARPNECTVLLVYFYTTWAFNLFLRENLCSLLLALEKHLNDIALTSEQMVGYQERIGKLDKEINIID